MRMFLYIIGVTLDSLGLLFLSIQFGLKAYLLGLLIEIGTAIFCSCIWSE